jgi:hypothetical protein
MKEQVRGSRGFDMLYPSTARDVLSAFGRLQTSALSERGSYDIRHQPTIVVAWDWWLTAYDSIGMHNA